MPAENDAEALRIAKGLPSPEKAYYLALDAYSNSGFEENTLGDLDHLIQLGEKVRGSRVRFPKDDDDFVRALREWIGPDNEHRGDWTFTYVAKHMNIWVQIDIEEGHYAKEVAA